MRLDIKALVIAAAVVSGASYLMCFLLVTIAPEATTAAAGAVIHADLSTLVRRVGIGSFVAGLVYWTVFAGGSAWLAGSIYNRSM